MTPGHGIDETTAAAPAVCVQHVNHYFGGE